jgi:hypothetical protein
MDWSGMEDKPLRWFHAEALRLALVERCQVASVTVPTVLNSAVAAGYPVLHSWITAFQSTMSSLFSHFANHTDNDGDWTGATSIPTWTEATMISAIGDSARVTPASSKTPTLAAWAMQQYHMLNKLLWLHFVEASPTTWRPLYITSVSYYDRQGNGADWDSLVTAWNGSSWVSRGGPLTPGGNIQYYSDAPLYIARRNKWNVNADGSYIRYRASTEATHSFSANVDFYMFLDELSDGFWCGDYGLSVESYYRLHQDIAATSSYVADISDAYTVGAFDGTPGDEDELPVTLGKYVGWSFSGIGVGGPHTSIAKFDVTDGFDFVTTSTTTTAA